MGTPELKTKTMGFVSPHFLRWTSPLHLYDSTLAATSLVRTHWSHCLWIVVGHPRMLCGSELKCIKHLESWRTVGTKMRIYWIPKVGWWFHRTQETKPYGPCLVRVSQLGNSMATPFAGIHLHSPSPRAWFKAFITSPSWLLQLISELSPRIAGAVRFASLTISKDVANGVYCPKSYIYNI